MFRLLFVSLLAGLWQSLEVAQCRNTHTNINVSHCYNASTGKTCFTTFLVNNSGPVRQPFKKASNFCNVHVPGSSLIVINSLESQRTVEVFIGRHVLENETIVIDARKLSASESRKWSWVNGHPLVPNGLKLEEIMFGRRNNKGNQRSHRKSDAEIYEGACVESKKEHSLIYCFDNVTSRLGYICEAHLPNDTSYYASSDLATWYDARKECLRLGRDLASITDLSAVKTFVRSRLTINQRYWIGLHRNKWNWSSTGAAITYTNWAGGYPDESSDTQCICIKPQCRRGCNVTDVDRKWRTCSCHDSYAIVCQKDEKASGAVTTVVTGELLPSTSKDFTSSAPLSVNTTVSFHSSSASFSASLSAPTNSTSKTATETRMPSSSVAVSSPRSATIFIPTQAPIATTPFNTTSSTTPFKKVIPDVTTYITTNAYNTARETDRTTVSTSSLMQKLSTYFAEDQTTALPASSAADFNSVITKKVLLTFLFVVAFIFIIVAVLLVIRKRKYAKRNETSPMGNTKQQSEMGSSVYATVAPDNIPSEAAAPAGYPIYADLEMTQCPTPSSNTIYASVQPTSEATDMFKSVVYADLDLARKDQQKTRSAEKVAVSLSPIYSQPLVPPTSMNNSEYAEPFMLDNKSTATAPVPNHYYNIAAVDQHNVYSLAKAIPLGDPNGIYSEISTPMKSSTPMT